MHAIHRLALNAPPIEHADRARLRQRHPERRQRLPHPPRIAAPITRLATSLTAGLDARAQRALEHLHHLGHLERDVLAGQVHHEHLEPAAGACAPERGERLGELTLGDQQLRHMASLALRAAPSPVRGGMG
jgi:nitrate reductase beta subunit